MCLSAHGQYIYFTAAVPHDITNPSGAPSQSGSRFRLDQPTRRFWVWNETSLTWVQLAQGIDIRSGCSTPVGVPVVGESNFAVNGCATPELYYHTGGGTWVCLNCASGGTNLTFTGASSPYTLNSSTGSDVTFAAGTNVTLSRSANELTISSSGGGGTVATDATLAGDGSGGSPLKIAQQSATASQVLSWTGATWEPSWGNPYTFVTTGGAITTAVNEILIGTVTADVVFGLPSCNAANNGKRFKFVRNGTDVFSLTIDPSGVETFYDGTSTKVSYSKLSIDCTCRFSVTGVWFFDNF